MSPDAGALHLLQPPPGAMLSSAEPRLIRNCRWLLLPDYKPTTPPSYPPTTPSCTPPQVTWAASPFML